jgi:hypothetical protein
MNGIVVELMSTLFFSQIDLGNIFSLQVEGRSSLLWVSKTSVGIDDW